MLPTPVAPLLLAGADHDGLQGVEGGRVEDGEGNHDRRHHDPRPRDDPCAWVDERGHHGGVREGGGGRRQGGGWRGAQLGERRGAAGRGAAGRAVGRSRGGAGGGRRGGGRAGRGGGRRGGGGGGGGALGERQVHWLQLGVGGVSGRLSRLGEAVEVRRVVEAGRVGEYDSVGLGGLHQRREHRLRGQKGAAGSENFRSHFNNNPRRKKKMSRSGARASVLSLAGCLAAGVLIVCKCPLCCSLFVQEEQECGNQSV